MPKFADLEKFFSDPKYSDDKEFLTGAVNKIFDDRIETEKKKKEDDKSSSNIFDSWFGGK